MTNLTIDFDDETLEQARIRALRQNTSVNAVLNRYLEEYARMDEFRQRRMAVLSSIFELAEANPIIRGDLPWNRDDLHER